MIDEIDEYEVEEEQNTPDMSEATSIIVRHILECAEELKELGFNMDDMEV